MKKALILMDIIEINGTSNRAVPKSFRGSSTIGQDKSLDNSCFKTLLLIFSFTLALFSWEWRVDHQNLKKKKRKKETQIYEVIPLRKKFLFLSYISFSQGNEAHMLAVYLRTPTSMKECFVKCKYL